MSLLLYITKRLDRIIIEGPHNPDFAAALNSIIPRYDRKYRSGVWDISDRWFPLIYAAARDYYIHFSCSVAGIDCRKPNPDWDVQWRTYLRAGHGTPTEIQDELGRDSARGRLFVTADAPQEVVTAAYRALAKMHHPDKGGDEEEFKAIDKAYKEITNGDPSS